MTPAKLEANRRNGAKSTGPRSVAGRARSALNATRHGITAGSVVLPHVETAEAWEEHQAGTLAALAPVGALEHELAERVAVLLWRLRRVTRFETATLGAAQETAERDAVRASEPAPHRPAVPLGHGLERLLAMAGEDEDEAEDTDEAGDLAALAADTRDSRAVVKLYARVRDLPDDARLTGTDAERLVSHMLENAVIDLEWSEDEPDPVNPVPVPGVPDAVPWEEWDGWTAGLVRAAAETLAALVRREAEGSEDPNEDGATCTGAELFEESAEAMENAARYREGKLQRARQALARLRGERCIPSEAALERVTRYELHLQRMLSVTLAELSRVRDLRPVVDVPPERDELHALAMG